ncbi:MAG: ArsR family transcriptional regulator [Deltaproteobacteria bacterium CG2_30_63_29]|nr:MAG: ArsR family transcriptional regulator [Deltaproteobacteria bacterium CG2_30_63_29]PJB45686.1 MAG: ArsR family transcriptional regulator [Deltaproteobacteria bacterium CG_4_9_14_3_um_filter_63_12]
MTSSSRQYKDSIYEQIARIGKSIGSGPRLEILDILCQGPRSVDVLAKQVGQPLANTSHHLQVLRRARLVETAKEGVHVTYRVASEEVSDFFRTLRELAASRLLEIEQVTRAFLQERGSMEPVNGDALVARVRSGAVTLLDVRPAEEFRAGHLPGAVSVPLGELSRRLAELPREREVVAYCRGPYCVLAIEAVELLKKQGFSAIRMEDGVLDWRARGLPVEVE